ncbi:MSHA biogenesis protein MshP [Pelomonas sp. SE-A7]|uniref:MSHA biogenesis protein MshP n=1 Tax=Pelomonas sp. SE-A7 TaxID=3054953 RepID=UPI00259CDAAF|nr:MSHA biogenesis protein MshP [Pelomonas sp. SE-A7]MDM4767792.1 MSHA biogenesis protein MshP [Pelomonas sp. SE-A7]
MKNKKSQAQNGLGAVAVLILLVVLAGLAAALVRLGSSSAASSALDITAARALQAANAGTQWGLFQALRGSWTTCAGTSQTLDLSNQLGMRVTVSCSSSLYNEGEVSEGTARTVRIYTIDAVACNSNACPDNSRAASPGYVERRKQVQASDS